MIETVKVDLYSWVQSARDLRLSKAEDTSFASSLSRF